MIILEILLTALSDQPQAILLRRRPISLNTLSNNDVVNRKFNFPNAVESSGYFSGNPVFVFYGHDKIALRYHLF